MEITDKLVQHIATLSRLSLTAEELAGMKGHFEKILRLVETLDKVDTRTVDPSIFPLDVSNVFAEDVSRPSLPVEESLRNSPDRHENYFMVPRIVASAGAAGPGAGAESEESE